MSESTQERTGTTAFDTPVRQIMRHGVVSIVEDALLESVFHAMAEHHVHAVLIEERTTGRPLGWVTAQSLLSWMNLEPSDTHAHQAITERVITVPPTAPVREAVSALSRAGASRLLVCADGAQAGEGVVTPLDIVALRAG